MWVHLYVHMHTVTTALYSVITIDKVKVQIKGQGHGVLFRQILAHLFNKLIANLPWRFQNVPPVPGDSSGLRRVQSALLSLLRSHGECPLQRHHWKERVRHPVPSSKKAGVGLGCSNTYAAAGGSQITRCCAISPFPQQVSDKTGGRLPPDHPWPARRANFS